MYESVERIRAEIERRLDEIERELAPYDVLVREREVLRHTLSSPPFAESVANGAGVNGNDAAHPRARRGENVRRVIEYVAANPGATVNDITDATGIRKAVVHNTVRALANSGRIERHKLSSRINAYSISTQAISRAA